MNLLLIILKYIGTAISGAAGIWGTVSETRDQKTGKLSRWGKWALGLAIGGFVVALSSQIAEQIRDEREQRLKEREHQQQVSDLKEQLALAKGIASSEESQKTRFDHVAVSLTFELPVADSKIQNLVDELSRLGSAYPADAHVRPLKENPTWEISRGTAGTGIYASPADIRAEPGIESLANCFAGLRGASMSLVLNKQAGASAGNPTNLPDLRTDHDRYSTNRAEIAYYSKSRSSLTIRLPRFDFDASDWTSNGKIIGIHDLTGAQLALQVWWKLGPNKALTPLVSSLRLVSATIVFGKFPCELHNFSSTRVSLPPGSRFAGVSATRYQCTLPDADAILSGKARR